MKLYESKEYDIQELYQRKEVSFSNNIEIFQILRKQVEDIVRYDHLSIYGMNPIPLYILHRYKQYGAYGYRELHTTE